MTIIDMVSDLHGYYPALKGGDLLIVAGDLTARDNEKGWLDFENWICNQKYKEKIIIGGNHDNFLASMDEHRMWKYWEKVGVTYLCDSSTEFEGLHIWGSPWTSTFEGMNPHCKAFTCDTEEELSRKWDLIPDNIDILVTHSPPYGILDKTDQGEHVGSTSLRNHVMSRCKPRLHCFGHIHECGGKLIDTNVTKFVNASIVNEQYQHVNKPVRIVL